MGAPRLRVTITNKDSSPLPLDGHLDALQDYLDINDRAAASLDPGASATVQLTVTAPSYAKAGAVPLTARLKDIGGSSILSPVSVTVAGGSASNVVGAYIFSGGGTPEGTWQPSRTPSVARYPTSSGCTARATSRNPLSPQSGNFQPFLPPGSGNCRFTSLGVWGNYLCGTPQHTVTADEVAQGFFVPSTVWQVTGSGAATQNYTVTGDAVDLLVRNPQLSGSVVSTFNDVDGDGFAGPGDTVTFAYTVTNSGNVALTDLSASAIGLSKATLAVGESVNLTSTYTLTDGDIAAKQLPATTIPVTGNNGAKVASLQLARQALALKIKPAMPGSEPALAAQNLIGTNPPLDLGLGADKYRTGQTVTVHNVEYGQWYYVYLNKRSYRLGWFFPTQQKTLSFVLPGDVKNGMDSTLFWMRKAIEL